MKMVRNAWNRMLSAMGKKWICRVQGHNFEYLKPWFICKRCGHFIHNTYPPQGRIATPGTTDHDDLINVTGDQHHDEDHQARHVDGGADEINTPLDTAAAPTSVPKARATAFETLLTGLGATTVATWTTTDDGLHHGVLVLTYFRVITGATVVTLQITYTNPDAVASTTTILLAVTEAVGDYTAAPIFILCDPNTAVDVVYTAGVINRVYASSTILEAGVPE